MSLKYTPVMQSILCLTFLMFMLDLFNVCRNHKTGGKKSKKRFAVYDSDTSVTLQQGEGDQTCYELADPKQGYNNAKFEKPCMNNPGNM